MYAIVDTQNMTIETVTDLAAVATSIGCKYETVKSWFRNYRQYYTHKNTIIGKVSKHHKSARHAPNTFN